MRMQKMSKWLLDLTERLLAQPAEKTSSEGAAAALLLAHVAWNRAWTPLAAIKSAITGRSWMLWCRRIQTACGS